MKLATVTSGLSEILLVAGILHAHLACENDSQAKLLPQQSQIVKLMAVCVVDSDLFSGSQAEHTGLKDWLVGGRKFHTTNPIPINSVRKSSLCSFGKPALVD